MEYKEENLYMIQNLRGLVGPHIVCEKSKILTAKYTRIKNPVDNYGLSWLTIEINLINTSTGEEWMLSLIAKTLPRYLESKKLAPIHEAFKKEVGIYMSAKPAMEMFLREKGLKNGADFFATPFGGRINVNGSDTVDQNAVLILQNYSKLGFTTVASRTGFDLESAKLVLKALAKFHGTFLGLKNKYPKLFNEKVKPHLSSFYMVESIARIAKRQMIQVLRKNKFSPELIERAAATFNRRSVKEAREPWATFIHNDTTVNNILIKYEKPGIPKSVKLLDFSVSEYNSPLRDVLLFLFSSVELKVLKTHLDDLIDYYYYRLIRILKSVDVTDQELFCRMDFNRELKLAASESEFYKTLCMLYPILITRPLDIYYDDLRDGIPELEDPLHKQRLCYIVREFDNRGWLYV